ncbi:MAG: hypothetical protein HKO02_00510 [Hyphomonadaceae bacterium]|nr:hypothetical protein [Hyphomonadaceae bacterium]
MTDTFARWKMLMNVFSLCENQKTHDALIKAYREKHRAYHTWDHIAACLVHLDAVRDHADHPHEIELALWFHDAIYKPFSSTNEKDSAIWAQEFFELNDFEDDDVVARVFDLIMVTEHTVEAVTRDAKLMIDIDLSILGAPANVYDQFEKNVRFEYKRVPTFIFKKKRRDILSEFLERDPLYKNEYFQKKLEKQAKENLETAINALS